MSTEPFIGEVKWLAFNFPPRGYALCMGQTMSIAAYSALFALIGTTYGGNGQTTFKLPDLQGRFPISQGQGPGLPAYSIGEAAGSNTTTVVTANMPPHIHTLTAMTVKLTASSASADEGAAQGNSPAIATTPVYSSGGPTANTYTGGAIVAGQTDATGSGIPIQVTNPYLVINYSIAVEGIFPSRN